MKEPSEMNHEMNFLRIVSPAIFLLFSILPTWGFSQCIDWASKTTNANFTEKEAASLEQFYEKVPLFIQAKVGRTSLSFKDSNQDDTSPKTTVFSFTATVDKVIKGNNVNVSSIDISYEQSSSESLVTLPKEGEDWIFPISYIYKDETKPYYTRQCQYLGFPLRQEKVYEAFEKIRQQAQSHGPVEDEATALKIALEYFKLRINSRGPGEFGLSDPTITRYGEVWKIAWDRIWVVVSARTGEAYQADSGTD